MSVRQLLCMYLFVRPLKAILESSPGRPERAGGGSALQSSKEAPIRRAAFKYTLLTWVAVLSTILGLVFIALTQDGTLIMVDLWANSMCLAFMTNWFDRYLSLVCCLPLCCVRWLAPCQYCCGLTSDPCSQDHAKFTVQDLTTL